MRTVRMTAAIVGLLVALGTVHLGTATADTRDTTRYIVVLKGNVGAKGFTGGDAVRAEATVTSAGGEVAIDLSRQIGVLVVDSANADFAADVRSDAAIDEVAEDFAWKAYPTRDEAAADHPGDSLPGGGPEAPHADPLEPMQWSMQQIRAPQSHFVQAGSRLVEVGILDTGIDGDHVDFVDEDGSNVNCAKGRDFIPIGPGIGNPNPCEDNNFHGTHVAGIVGARANGVGVVGVAPNVELIPVKVCDAIGYCYASSTAAGITYAGDAKFEVANMSFFVDDDVFLQSTEFKCMNDPVQRAFRKANERAIQYARNQGVVPVAALGNSDNDLAHPPEPYENNCDVVPAETQGVIGTMALGPASEKAFYSNYGVGATDVAAPGGNSRSEEPAFPGPCGTRVISTFPNDTWACIQGTSMASPHAAGVVALIVSQYGRIGTDAGETDVVMRPTQVEAHLQGTTIDIGLPGYDECFGHGRIDALKAVQHDTSRVYQATPFCPEYEE
jgi:lantibiotic leader peptide-processing serine protease